MYRPEDELQELKRMFTKFLANKAQILANQVWDEKGWSNDDMKQIAKEDLRIRHKK